MANGNPDFEIAEWPALERFFNPIADRLESFAARHELRLVKYDKQNRSWDFLFRHPAGGVVRMQVLQAGDDTVALAAHWHICDFGQFRRSTLSLDRGVVARDDPRLAVALESLLAEILSMSTDRLTPDGVDWRPYWRTNVLEAIQAEERALPLPIS